MSCKICSAKSQYTCLSCEGAICKNCVHFLEKDSFAFHPKPPKWNPGAYCDVCFQKHLAADLHKYQEVEEAAKEVLLIRKSYKGFLPILRKNKENTTVKNHTDKKSATMHLAFLALWNGYDSVVHFSEECEKVRNSGWERKAWKASGLFVTLDKKRLRVEPDSS